MKNDLRLLTGKKLKSPPGKDTRPTTSKVREALINILREKIVGSNWLDLFSGSGVIGCEALQNGALKVLAIEKNRNVSHICKENLLSTASDDSSISKDVGVIQHEVLKFLDKKFKDFKIRGFEEDMIFNFVYLDPPYKDHEIYSEVLRRLINGKWVRKDSIVICEHSSERTIWPDSEWVEIDRRNYGNSSLLFVSPQN